MKLVCSNKWCKSHYESPEDCEEKICPKCRSLDFEMSGGITWTDKNYEGSRYDDSPHQIDIKVTRYYK